MSITLATVQLTCKACGAEMQTIASQELIREACDKLMESHSCTGDVV